ncbi:MAG: translation initiation factor IF-2 [Deltaproteobacteria bacterium]|nr:MAG: translation initiation factor IF-2 [Deltaproteobacteria bacterium]
MMAKIRVRDLAKELDVKNAYLIQILEEKFGLYNLKPASGVEEDIANKLRDHVIREKDKGSEAKVIKKEDGTVIRKHKTFVLKKRRRVQKEEAPAGEGAAEEPAKEISEEGVAREEKVAKEETAPPAVEEAGGKEEAPAVEKKKAKKAISVKKPALSPEEEEVAKVQITKETLTGASVKEEAEKEEPAVSQPVATAKVVDIEERKKAKKKPKPEKKAHKGVLKKKALEELIEEEEIKEEAEKPEEEKKGEVVERVFEPGRYPRRRKVVEREKKGPATLPPKERKKVIKVEEKISVMELSRTMGVKVVELMKKFRDLGVQVEATDPVDAETAALVAEDFGYRVENVAPEYEKLFEETEDREEDLVPRPPIVTVMGHVDHGKTTLLDAIRKTNVAEGEAGGITQSVGASEVEVNGKKITFIDTPGHEAFTQMRARGGKAADIVILVVAADDGVMPQTIEAIDHARAANIPIVVAINKIDKPNANPDRVKNELAEHGLIPEEWGGDVLYAHISALKKEGLDELLEMVLLQAEILDLKANPKKKARGVIIETGTEKGKGNAATAVIKEGTLRVGDAVIAGTSFGRVRALIDHKGKRIKEAGPSKPVEILGFNTVPTPGEILIALDDEKVAREVALKRLEKEKEKETAKAPKISLEDLYAKIQEGELKELNVIVKADVQGSVDAVKGVLEKVGTEQVKVNVIHAAVGGITESDVNLASASEAIVLGFRVRPDGKAKKAAEREKVEVKTYDVIYDLIDDVKKAMVGLLEPEYREVVQGTAEVRETFNIPKVGTVAGCYVTEGKILRNAKARVLRDSVVIFTGNIASLKRFKDDVREVQQGYECGIGLENFNDVKPGDIIECFILEEVAPEL